MKKFLVMYLAPVAVLEEWKKTDPNTRKAAEEKMRGEWRTWMQKHAQKVTDTAGAGKTKRVTGDGVANTRNDIMLYSIVEAESHAEAAKIFEGHPHFQIPQSSIEVMEINPLSGM
jgi:hypothetical protein